jgi:tetrahydromethanopterin S-methyltransferase subunit G
MNVDAPRKRWTGDRLDGLDEKVGDGFAQVAKQFEKVDERFEKVEGKIESAVKELRADMDARFERLNERFTHLTWGLFSAAVVIIAAFIAL